MSKTGRWAVALALGLALAGCGGPKTYTLRPVERTSGAVGVLRTEKGDNQNTQVELHVQHMPDPGAIDPAFKTYVLWLRPAGEQDWKNMGALRLNDEREAKLSVVTPYPTFDVQVTAEPESTVSYPGSAVVLTGQPD
ncbi:MAG TPA: hypothetical protein VFO83_00490 [Aggregicoccus sp.]|nr:hypothetical protein [Aggregicoccus sp.]